MEKESNLLESKIESPEILRRVMSSRGLGNFLSDEDYEDVYLPDQKKCWHNSCWNVTNFDFDFIQEVSEIKYRQDILREGIENNDIYKFIGWWLHPHFSKEGEKIPLRERFKQDQRILNYISMGISVLEETSSEGLNEVRDFLKDVAETKKPELKKLEELSTEFDQTKVNDVELTFNLEYKREYGIYYITNIDSNLRGEDNTFHRNSNFTGGSIFGNGSYGLERTITILLRAIDVNGNRASNATALRVYYKTDVEPYVELDFERETGFLKKTIIKSTERITFSEIISANGENCLGDYDYHRSERLEKYCNDLIESPKGAHQTKNNVFSDYFRKKREAIKFEDVETELESLSDQLSAYSFPIKYCRGLKEIGDICFPELLPAEAKVTEIEEGVNPFLIRRQHFWNSAEDNEKPIANDYSFDPENRMQLVTGSVAGGKTVYAEGLYLIQLMAQSGLPIPAKSAKISLVDEVYVHKVSPGDLYNSRFQFEMENVRTIFDNATPNSLILMDEPCGSTDHTEGLEISKGFLDGINQLGSRCIYVTHMHDLTDYVEEKRYAKNLHVEYIDGKPTYKIKPGKAGSSHSISLASEYGLDKDSLIKRLAKRAENEWKTTQEISRAKGEK